jgi:hypothetical protein
LQEISRDTSLFYADRIDHLYHDPHEQRKAGAFHNRSTSSRSRCEGLALRPNPHAVLFNEAAFAS